MAEEERLNRFLARAGVASRRASDALIEAGRIAVNGQVVTHLGTRIDPATDQVTYDGKPVQMRAGHTYVLLNKPAGYLVSVSDPHHDRTVFDLLTGISERVFPVGRLDLDTFGVLLLTDDGDLSFRLMHPRFGVEKTYRVLVQGRPEKKALTLLREGVDLEDGKTAPARVKIVKLDGPNENAVMDMVLHEGRKRQVKRMCLAVGHRVMSLTRLSFAGLTADGLELGKWRHLTGPEVGRLKRLVGMTGEHSVEKPQKEVPPVAPHPQSKYYKEIKRK